MLGRRSIDHEIGSRYFPMKKNFTDQMERQVEVNFPPKRIVSIVPSQTELLYHLGLDEEVAGLTKFCIHPREKWKSKPKVGGTKKLHIDRIAALQPDLIIGNKEENDRSQIEELEKHFPVWMSDIVSIEDALGMIESVGKLVNKPEEATYLVKALRQGFNKLQATHNGQSPTAAYIIWRKPWMATAGGTFIDSMLQVAGFKNVFSEKTRYPTITLEELATAKPEVVMLSSEPYPFKEEHFDEIHEQCQTTVVKLVDGEMFSWYGSRMLQALGYLANLRNDIFK